MVNCCASYIKCIAFMLCYTQDDANADGGMYQQQRWTNSHSISII